MKIIIFSDNVAPYRMDWAEELAKDNQVEFAYLKDKDSLCNSEWLVKKSNNVKMVKLPAKIIKNRAFSFSVKKYIKNNKADIYIFDGYGIIPNVIGMRYCKKHNIDYFINIDGVRIGHKESLLARILKKSVFSKNAKYLCGSDYSAQALKKYGVTEDKICIHNFTSLHDKDIICKPISLEQKSQLKKERNLSDMVTLIAVGRFVKLKQFDLLLKAFKPHDDKCQLLIIGEGSEEQVYKDIIKEYDIKNVRIIKFMPLEKLKAYYQLADGLLLTSNSEVWGLVINEGMGYGGLPIIASSRCVGGYSLVNYGVNGYTYPFDDVNKLSKAIADLLESDRNAMSIESIKIIKDYTVELTAKRHVEFFNKHLAQKEN